MNMRERMWAIVRGEGADRVPFVNYDGIAASAPDIWQVIGRENMGLLRWCGVTRTEHPNCRVETEAFTRDGLRGERHTLITPRGRLVEEKLFDPALNTAATPSHYIRELADYPAFLAYLRDIRVTPDMAGFEGTVRDLGDDGLPLLALARTPYQQMWIQWVSLEDLCLHMADDPGLLEECFAELGRIQRDAFRAVAQAVERFQVPFVDFPDNITAPAIGETFFRKYCMPYYRELADLLKGRDVLIGAHFDGELRPLRKAIAESPIRAIDSFSPEPDNDNPVDEALQWWPGVRLFVNFPSSVHLLDDGGIYARTKQILEEGGHSKRLWIQVSENVPPGRWRQSYPPIVRALRDFGRP